MGISLALGLANIREGHRIKEEQARRAEVSE